MQLIQKLTVVSAEGNRIFEVGEEVNGREIIEIKTMGFEHGMHVQSEYHVLDENGNLISIIENCPVVIDWVTIVEHEKAVAATTTK